MDILKLKAIYELQYKLSCSQDTISYLQRQFERYNYPVGAILDIMYSVNCDNFSIYNKNKEYFTNIINILYGEIYTAAERQIIVSYISQHFLPVYQWFDEKIPEDVYKLIFTHFDKEEILSLQDELKYKYVIYAMRSNSPNKNLIKKLLNELENSTAPDITEGIIKAKDSGESNGT